MPRVLGLDLGPTSVRAALLRIASKKAEVERYIEVPFSAVEGEPDPLPPPSAHEPLQEQPSVGGAEQEGYVAEASPPSPEDFPTSPGAPIPGDPAPSEPASGTPTSRDGASVEVPEAGPSGEASRRTRALRRVLACFERPPDRIIACLSGVDASLRTVEVPAGAARRIAEVLPFELETLLPFSVEDAVIDHQPLERTNTELRLLAAAAPKDRVATLLAELADAKIFPRELAVGSAALGGLTALIPSLTGPEPVLLLEAAEETTDVCVLRNGAPMLSRTLSEGAGDRERLEASLRRTLAAFRAQHSLELPYGLVLGPLAEDPSFAAFVSEATGIAIEPLPLPVAPLQHTPGVEAPATGEPGLLRFGRAVALAARTTSREKRLDLLKGEFAVRSSMGTLRRQAPLLVGCAAAIVFTLVLSMWAQYMMLSDEQEALQAQLEVVTESSFGRAASSVRRARQFLDDDGRDGDPLPRHDGYALIATLSSLIPTDVEHDTRRLNFELEDDGYGSRLELQGTVGAVADRDQIVTLLEQHECAWCEGESGDELKCFQEIERGPTAPGPGGEGVNYQIEARLRCPNDPEPEERSRRRSR